MKSEYQTPQKVGIILEEVLSQKGYYSICKELSIAREWPSIVDPAFAAATTCDKIENGILYVKVHTAPWRQEASYMKEKIISKIRQEFRCSTIKDIVFY
jgi:predicted nucleic acid-binding Zn ribbon protein